MTYTFRLTTKSPTPFLKTLNTCLKEQGSISSEKEYNKLLQQIIALAKKYPLHKKQGSLFTKALKEGTKNYPLAEPTVWGGVSLKEVNVEKDYIRKLLVVKQYGILGFEIHKEKLEKLHVLEGICLLISSQHSKEGFKQGVVNISLGEKGSKVVLEPGDEHGIIVLTDCVIEEQSTNHLTDLVYIFNTSQVI